MAILHEAFTLSNGLRIPKLGFGTWQIPDGKAAHDAVTSALRAGYTHIDTAAAYENEVSVGKAVRDSGIERSKLFITTKIPAEIKTYAGAAESIRKSLERLDLGYIDLILIHAPKPWSKMGDDRADRCFEGNAQVWKAMEESYARGELKSIGISNFQIVDIEQLAKKAKVQPMVNQIRAFIGSLQNELVVFCQARGIVVEAYSPFATGRILDNPRLKKAAQRLGVSVPQLCLKYVLAKDLLPLPKSTHDAYIQSNTQLDFDLTPQDLEELDALRLDD